MGASACFLVLCRNILPSPFIRAIYGKGDHGLCVNARFHPLGHRKAGHFLLFYLERFIRVVRVELCRGALRLRPFPPHSKGLGGFRGFFLGVTWGGTFFHIFTSLDKNMAVVVCSGQGPGAFSNTGYINVANRGLTRARRFLVQKVYSVAISCAVRLHFTSNDMGSMVPSDAAVSRANAGLI